MITNRTAPQHGAEATALRLALMRLEELAYVLTEASVTTDEVERGILSLQRRLTAQLREAELALWTESGLPEVPRNCQW